MNQHLMKEEKTMQRKKLPLGIQTFDKIIAENYVYVDKTKQIFKLLNAGGYFFLSRPRRFGKSLLLTTLKELFSGNQRLFQDLWIEDKIDWEKYPVIHLDMSVILGRQSALLEESLLSAVNYIGRDYGLPSLGDNYQEGFERLIRELAQENRVVVLIDEYDKPLTDYLDQPELADQNRKILNSFYSVLKSSDAYLRFVFLTGVSKFSQVSIFSAMNNLIDITIDDRFADIVGYTEAEMSHYFADYLAELAKKMRLTQTELLENLGEWYNGYSWDGETRLYNPHSILNLLSKQRVANYWFQSGTPSFLLHLIRSQQVAPNSFANIRLDELGLNRFEPLRLDLPALLWQTGYLTIKKIEGGDFDTPLTFLLDYPNREVKESLLGFILQDFSKAGGLVSSMVADMAQDIQADDLDSLFKRLQTVFASIPYNIFEANLEKYYHTVIYLVFSLIGFRVEAEIETNVGRIDALLHTRENIYLMEFKMSGAEDALQQIEKKDYAAKYRAQSKQIVLVGVGFSEEKKNIDTWLVRREA